MAKPGNLLYGVEDRPPLGVVLLGALQHVAVITAIGIVFPLLVLDRLGGTAPIPAGQLVSLSMLALGLATILQCGRWGPVGSGFLAPSVFTAAYLPASLIAVERGGLPLVMGMTMFAGLCQAALAPALRALRPYLPTEIAGIAVLMIGLVLGLLGFRLMFGIGAGPAAPQAAVGWGPGVAALVATIALSVWSKGQIRLLAALVGILVGTVVALALGHFDIRLAALVAEEPMLRLPAPIRFVPAFDVSLAPQYLIAALACTLRAMGDIATCQKINDSRWTRPDMRTLRGGVLADGLGTLLAGLVGTVGLNTFSGSVGLSVATGVAARRVGLAAGIIFVLLSMLPFVSALLVAIPRAVTGAVLLFSAAFIIINGAQVMMSRLLDNRKIIMIGVALSLGFSYEAYPAFYRSLPGFLANIAGSELLVAIGAAILLNLVFRVGIWRTAELELRPGSDDPDAIGRFLRWHGGQWGARRDVVERVAGALEEFRDGAPELLLPGTAARIEVGYDEFRIDVRVRYEGRPLDLRSALPEPGDLASLEIDALMPAVRAVLLRRLADKVAMEREGRHHLLRLQFEH